VLQDGPGEKPTAATPETGLKPSGHFRLQQIKQCTSKAATLLNYEKVYFQPQKVGGQRIGLAHKD